MKRAMLDGRAVSDRASLHDALSEALDLPCWYGRNLDALFDCLTDIHEETELCLCHFAALEEKLDGYAHVLLTVLMRAQEENPCLRICREEGEEAFPARDSLKMDDAEE